MEIFDQLNHGNSQTWSARGFKDLAEAEAYKDSILASWGYSPSAFISQEEPEIIVKCRMYNSCD